MEKVLVKGSKSEPYVYQGGEYSKQSQEHQNMLSVRGTAVPGTAGQNPRKEL